MTALSPSILRRLRRLPQIPCVWEGDRRPVSTDPDLLESERGAKGECILWVDGSQGIVRSVDMVAPKTGLEAIVRVLLRAMEHPHKPAQAARPQKIVVCDREILFFLRGVLQDLDIVLEYVPDLPLIDEIFRGFEEVVSAQDAPLPPQYMELLEKSAAQIWQDGPWEGLSDHQILSIELNRWDIGTFYASVLGMLGLDYGILLYRSLESLKQFRTSVLEQKSVEQLEAAFLSQDCLFLTYESLEEWEDEDDDLMDLPWSEIEPTFGNLHPYEGLRPYLYEEEAIAMWVALVALHRFFRAHNRKLSHSFPALGSQYKIALPSEISSDPSSIQVRVSTLPDLATELFEMAEAAEEEEEDGMYDIEIPILQDDLVPPNALLGLRVMPWETVELLRDSVEHHQPGNIPLAVRGFPVFTVQTTRPKAKTLIEQIKSAGGVQAMGFNPGENPFDGESYELGIVQTHDRKLHLFGEFHEDDPAYAKSRRQWDSAAKTAQGFCGLIVAMGATGATRGNPQLKDMMALFEMRFLSPEELGLGSLQMVEMLS